MADALDKVTNMMLPNLEGNQMANLLGVDTVRKARGRGLLDAGLTAMALAGPRPANENVNTAMILKQMVDQGTNTYDKSIDRATNQLQTTTALQDEVEKMLGESTDGEIVEAEVIELPLPTESEDID